MAAWTRVDRFTEINGLRGRYTSKLGPVPINAGTYNTHLLVAWTLIHAFRNSNDIIHTQIESVYHISSNVSHIAHVPLYYFFYETSVTTFLKTSKQLHPCRSIYAEFGVMVEGGTVLTRPFWADPCPRCRLQPPPVPTRRNVSIHLFVCSGSGKNGSPLWSNCQSQYSLNQCTIFPEAGSRTPID